MPVVIETDHKIVMLIGTSVIFASTHDDCSDETEGGSCIRETTILSVTLNSDSVIRQSFCFASSEVVNLSGEIVSFPSLCSASIIVPNASNKPITGLQIKARSMKLPSSC